MKPRLRPLLFYVLFVSKGPFIDFFDFTEAVIECRAAATASLPVIHHNLARGSYLTSFIDFIPLGALWKAKAPRILQANSKDIDQVRMRS